LDVEGRFSLGVLNGGIILGLVHAVHGIPARFLVLCVELPLHVEQKGEDDEGDDGGDDDASFVETSFLLACRVVDLLVTGSEHEGDEGHELDKHVESRATGVLEGIANGISRNDSSVSLGALAGNLAVDFKVALLDPLLSVVPSTTGVGHGNGQQKPETRAPARTPASMYTDKKPQMIGVAMAMPPGKTISSREDFVAILMHSVESQA